MSNGSQALRILADGMTSGIAYQDVFQKHKAPLGMERQIDETGCSKRPEKPGNKKTSPIIVAVSRDKFPKA